jgi:DNA-binding response OmpR family regulator
MRLLVIEDSAELLKPLVAGLKRSGYEVDQAADGKSGLWMAEGRPYDLIVLDIMLPGLDGISLLRRLRERGSPTRVLLLTAKDAVEDRVAGLRAGADDYLVKPFSFDELLARVEALLRRAAEPRTPVLRVGEVSIDTAAKSVRCGDAPVTLAPREYAILEYLARHRGRVVSRTEIEQNVYDALAEPMSNVVDSAICAIRRKIDADGAPSLIQTRRGHGYLIPAAAAGEAT